MNKQFASLCTPAKLYFILSLFSCIIAFLSGVKFMAVAVNLIIAFIWTAILGWICKSGFTPISWALVLFPYIVMMLVFLGVMRAINSSDVMVIIPPSATQQMV